jgi:phage terminase small subunit
MSKEQMPEKWKRFCEEYIIDLNGKQAAIRAGYSPKTAESQASRLLRNAKVQEYLSHLREKVSKKLELTKEMVAEELRRILISDIRGFYRPDGSLKNIQELTDEQAAALAGVETDEIWGMEVAGEGLQKKKLGETKKIKRYDKIAAAAQINKMMGWNAPEKVEHTGDSFLDLLMKTSTQNTSENEPRQKKKPKPKSPKPATKRRSKR